MADPTVTEIAGALPSTAVVTANFSARTAGQLLILSVAADDYRLTSGSNRPESTGWTFLDGVEGNLGHYVWWKIAAGGETSVQYAIGSATRSAYSVLSLTDIEAIPLGVTNKNDSGVFTNIASPRAIATVTPTSGARWCVIACVGTTGTVNNGPYAWAGGAYTEQTERYHTAGYRPGTTIATAMLDGGTAVNGTVAFTTADVNQVISIVAAFEIVVAGGSTVSGVVTSSFGGTFTTSGIPRVRGAAVSSFGGTFAAAGLARKLGVVNSAFGGTFITSGRARKFGTVASSFGGSLTTTGQPRKLGQAVSSFGFTVSVVGVRRVRGAVVSSFGGTFTASGVVGTPPVQGQVTSSFGGSFTASGTRRVRGAAVSSFGGAFLGVGVNRQFGQVVSTFGFTTESLGIVRVRGQVVCSFGGTLDASGTSLIASMVYFAQSGVFVNSIPQHAVSGVWQDLPQTQLSTGG